MKNIKVSVIVPVYKVENYIERCIKSLVNQTLKEIEIIMVNDGSPDNSQLIIDKYKKLYPEKIVSLIKDNGGLSDARNYGIDHAKGQFIAFLDGDDYADISFLEKMYNRAIESNSDIVVCGYYAVDEINNTYKWYQKGKMDFFDKSLEEEPSLIHRNSPYAWNKIYSRDLFTKYNIRFPKGLIFEDIPTTYPLLACANKISKIDQPLIYYILKRKGSITSTYSYKMLELFKSLELLINRFRDLGLYEKYYDEVLFLNMRHIIFRFKDFNKYKNYKLKFNFVRLGFSHLNKYFPGWKKNDYYFTEYCVGHRLKKQLTKSKYWWYLSILIPNSIKNCINKMLRTLKKGLNLFSKYNINKFIYSFYSHYSKLDDQLVLFESFHGTTISDSPFYMMKELCEENVNYKICFTTTRKLYNEHLAKINEYGYNIKLVKLGTPKYVITLAKAKYLVNNVSFPPYFVRRKGQKYLNTWHGTPLKTLGKKMVEGIEDMSNMQRNFLHCTSLLYPNEYTLNNMMEDYNLFNLYTGESVISGYPRNSIFLNKEKEKEIREKYKMSDKEVFAYMPTWRGKNSGVANNKTYATELKTILSKLDDSLSDNQILYVNLHSLVKDHIEIDGYKHIYPFPNIDNYEFLNAVDVLITDYSSVFFDFSITKKPIVLFMYDYDEYMKDRGVYLNIKDLPFVKLYNISDLINYIKTDNKYSYNETNARELENYYNLFTSFDSPNSPEILNDYFFGNNKSSVKLLDFSYNANIKRTAYIPNKIVHREDAESLKELDSLQNPVVIFSKNQFNYILRESLLNKYNDKVDYVVVQRNVAFSLHDRFIMFLNSHFHIINADKSYYKYVDNFLPNLNFIKVMFKNNPSRYLYNIYESLSNKINKK